MKLEDILTKKEIEEYHEQWSSFPDKYKPQAEYMVHSGMPIIGQVFRFKDYPVFRAHIFGRKLRKTFDLYFISKKGYIHRYFHITHYFIVMEQIYHASMPHLIKNYNKFMTFDSIDTKNPLKMIDRIDFYRTKASVELIPDVIYKTTRYVARLTTTFYNDKNNSIIQVWPFRTIGEQRQYVYNIEKLKKGDKSVIKDFIREIQGRTLMNKKLIKPKKDLLRKKDYLISELKKGNIPEEELHDFFSFWDPPKNNNL